MWDAYDEFVGLPPLRERNLQSPARLSSVLHWRTLQRLLLLVSKPTSITQPTYDFIDAHCHIDRLLNKSHCKGTLSTFLQREHIDTSRFAGCIAVFCDQKTLTDDEWWAEMVADKLVYAAVGAHPKQNDRTVNASPKGFRPWGNWSRLFG